ncbi:MAG TPA: lytic transglycosylase domain-containing protein [Pyrinomonadaceae bacterium]|nr:lytic transglycosylase domain-containing protein [Pyrinomonadaceae bacterium]
MKKSSFACALLLVLVAFFACATLAQAQTASARYHHDNFDIAGGVQVTPEPTPAPPADAPGKAKRGARPLTVFEKEHVGVKPTLYARPTNTLPMSASASLDGFTTGDAKVDSYIADSSARHGVDPVLIYSIMHRESAFKKMAVSYKGARGLMQLMPATAARFGVRNIFDPAQNIDAGTRYIRFLLNRFGGDVGLALAGYNAGEGAVDKYRGVPPYRETQEYVKRISERYALMRDPQTARRAPVLTKTPDAIASTANADTPAPQLYERNVYAVRLPDGKLMLVTQ